jgi:endonuclease YncB( thermonuclease family)
MNANKYNQVTEIFPYTGTVLQAADGDTFQLTTGIQIRLLGINAPDRGHDGYTQAKERLTNLLEGKVVYLEYDRYQDDKYGRILAWVWSGCEKDPVFTPYDYMKLTSNTSKEGLTENPEGCNSGTLINELLVKEKLASFVVYKDRGELKYQQRLQKSIPAQ